MATSSSRLPGVRDQGSHGAVEGAGLGAGSIAPCKTKPQRQRQPRRSGVPRSNGCRQLREAVDAAIADGATIDEIAALIIGARAVRARARPSESRYIQVNVRDLIRQQQEIPTVPTRCGFRSVFGDFARKAVPGSS